MSTSGSMLGSVRLKGAKYQNAYATNLEMNASGNLVIGGAASMNMDYKGIFIEVDQNGSVISQKSYQTGTSTSIKTSKVLRGGGFITCGKYSSGSSVDIMVTKHSQDYSVLWTTKMTDGTNGFKQCKDIVESEDGSGFFFTGFATVGNKILIASKIDNSGTVQTFTGQSNTILYGKYLVQMSDGGYLVCAEQQTGTFGSWDIVLVKYNGNGQTLNSWIMGSANKEECQNMESYTNGLIAIIVYDDTAESTNIVWVNQDLEFCMDLTIQTIQLTEVDLSSGITISSATTSVSEWNYFRFMPSDPLVVQDITEDVIYQKNQLSTFYNSIYEINQVASPTDTCGCETGAGTCSSSTGQCECSTGFEGTLCQFTSAQYTNYSTQIQAKIYQIYTYPPQSGADYLTQLEWFTSFLDLLTDQAIDITLTIIFDNISASTTEDEMKKFFSILSYVIERLTQMDVLNQNGVTTLTSIMNKVGSIYSATAQEFFIKATHIQMVARQIEQTSRYFTISFINSTLVAKYPSALGSYEVPYVCNYLLLKNYYTSLIPTGKSAISPVLSLNFFSNGQIQTSTTQIILIQMSIESNSAAPLTSIISDIYVSGIVNQTKIIQDKDIECVYFDNASKTLVSDQCRVTQISQQFIECECSRFVDLFVLVNTNYQSITESSYSGFSHLDTVYQEDFISNLGSYILVVNFGFFIVFGLIAWYTDQSTIQYNLLQVIKEDLHGISIRQSLDFNETTLDLQTTSKDQGTESYSRSPTFPRIGLARRSTLRSDINQKSQAQNFRDQSVSRKESLNRKLDLIYNQSRNKSCGFCYRFWKSALNEQQSNNLLCNLLARTSAVTPRCFRLCILQISILTTISCCALYIDLIEDVHKNSDFNLTKLVLIGGLAALGSIVVILILGLVFKLCPVKLTSTIHTRSAEILEEYSEKKSIIRCRLAVAVILFIGITGIQCLYLIAFFHISDSIVEEDWITSSLIGVGADFVLVQSVIALSFGVLGSIWGCCGKCVGCILLPLNIVRQVKNFN